MAAPHPKGDCSYVQIRPPGFARPVVALRPVIEFRRQPCHRFGGGQRQLPIGPLESVGKRHALRWQCDRNERFVVATSAQQGCYSAAGGGDTRARVSPPPTSAQQGCYSAAGGGDTRARL